MDNNLVTQQLNDILNNNNHLTLLQRNALQEAVNKIKPGISTQDVIELIKILAAILMMDHST